MLNRAKALAITSVALDKMSEAYAETDEFPGYVAAVQDTVIGFGATEVKAVDEGLANGTIQWPTSGDARNLQDVVDILKHGAIVTWHRTKHGVLITDEN